MFGAAGPDFLAVDDIVIAVLHSARFQAERIGAAGGFGDTESLKAQFPAGDARQVMRLLALAAVTQQRVHDIHLRVGG